ncbi:MAG: SGNH/GDSL hydrolase family protein, partial [Bacteroidota bacterium]|nr:SGNH/GDSL hydrolase family protein [Bacteroidota bacterium]
ALNYVGRFDFSNNKQVRYDWSGTQIRFRFTGKSLAFHLNGGERNFFNVFIDDLPAQVISSTKDSVIWVAKKLKKREHTCILYKRTEGGMGQTIFSGVYIDKKAKVFPWSNIPLRRIEFIGNSITCGYGTEGKDRHERFKPETENNFKSYASIVARAFNADFCILAHSGLGVVRNYGDTAKVSTKITPMPGRIEQALDTDPVLRWDVTKDRPQALVINLGTNDFSTHPYPDKLVFKDAYTELIKKLRTFYGEIPIFCLAGPILDEPCYSYVKEMVEDNKVLNKDGNLYFVGIPTALIDGELDLGSDQHPNYSGQKKMAAQIVPVIATVLKWDYDDSELRKQ